ncbi:HD domain-containing phosphohydrolase [Cytobacillus oceanisediminis]|uniref:HD domain-containing phosphohydrolase n=1 Tax=Cytobacillus oceanisediminis TaxID=665099 RepID=UPI001FB1EEC6|nr:HD domain-containing phosphohydrolase [Cytobacillus oceanisediminis]UOE53932.1 HD domain-containing protein [Cytobacillus oceanisediminis]
MGIINEDSFIETVHMKGLQISLIASGDGTEVIYHKLDPGTMWGIEPQEGWQALEYLCVLSGELILRNGNETKKIKTGSSFFRAPVEEHYVFEAAATTEFLYVTSRPVFFHYSKVTKEMMELSISIEEKDGYTRDHCQRINKLSMLVGKTLELDSKQLVNLNLASFLHDVGKLRIPLEILQKPSKLTPKEWETMKKHSAFGREILEETGLPLLIDAGKVVEQHHERFDGKGYPQGLKGSEISIEASIISIIDSYDAITTDRVYKKGRSKEEAKKELLNYRGTMYHPEILDVFLELIDQI